jgi:hypothetical protein
MPNGEDKEDMEIRSETQGPLSPEPKFRKWVGVNIKLVDGHYLATFNHDAPRIFHNMAQLLTAIEVEAAKLGPGPTQT